MAQTLETIIRINAEMGSGFSKVGATLTELGSIVNGLSQRLINFGEESIDVYRNYEMSMRDAEVALSTTYGQGTQQLQKVMGQLDESATEWAATTIFHTNDVANAISEAAHAGWDYDQIMAGIPAAMQLAQAGSLDLSEAVNYIVKSTNAAGISFEDMGHFIDLWTFAANSSASTIGEFGDSMLRMGSTMRFASNPEELMTLIAVTADAGSVGSEAGTMIRNSIMRLIAPTQKAQDAMELLGATSDETAEIMNDEALAAANAALASRGFNVFDQETGEMRPVLDIYQDLNDCLAEIAGGYENISSNEDALAILSAIFPTRTITEALNLLNATADGYGGLYDAMMEGAAEGYGQYAADTMMDTLNGNIEIFESKVERLKQIVGGELKGQVVDAAGFAGELVDKLAEMDPDAFSALITGAEVLAVAGPGLLIAGGAFRLIGLAMTPIGGAAAGLLALATAAAVLKDLEMSDFADNFGNMELDLAPFTGYVRSLGDGFRNTYQQVDAFHTAMDEAVASYEAASGTFSGTLLTDMLTNVQLTDADKSALMSLGDDMLAAVKDGITNSYAGSMSYWEAFFGGEGTAEDDDTFREIINLSNEAYESAIAEAESIGQGLRDAMTAAFADGEISPEEYQNILSYMQSYNAAIARAASEAQAEEDYIQTQKWLHQAQTASLDEVQDIARTATEERDAILADQEDRYLTERFRLEYNGADSETLARTDAIYQQQQQQTAAAYDEFLTTLWDSQIQQGGQAENYAWLSQIAGMYLEGGVTSDTALDMITEQLGRSVYAGQSGWGASNSDRAQLGKMLGFWVDSMGGEDAVAERISYYEGIGNQAMADQITQMYAMEQLVNGFETVTRTGRNPWDLIGFTGDFSTTGQNDRIIGEYNRSAAEAVFASQDYSVDIARRTVETLGGADGPIGQFFDAVGQQIETNDPYSTGVYEARRQITGNTEQAWNGLMNQLAAAYDFSAIIADFGGDIGIAQAGSGLQESFAAWQLLYGGIDAEQYRIQVIPEIDTSAMQTDFDPVPLPIEPYVEGTDAMESLQNQGVEVSVGADATELSATIDGEDGQTLLQYLDGDATDLHMVIMGEDGQQLTEIVHGNTASLAAAINSYNGRTITVNIAGNRLFASGGRATSASIFGEAGPEWAIPEEHSERTAELLNAARAASGFTWPDLLARFGGLNANANNTPTTIVYSPVIHAQDARGVAEALREDHARFEKWWNEKQMHDAVEVYQ
jgi:TP901 family phage tail tape measure protein